MVIAFLIGMVIGGAIAAVGMAMLACNGKEEIDREREGY